MKKILTTILAGTLVAGAAFAADASVKLNYRARLDAFSLLNKDDGNGGKDNNREWMNWNGYGGTSNDTLDIQIKSDMFGARITTALKVNGGSTPISKVKEFSGWMKFNVGPGTLKLDAGNWDDGYADGNYRVKKDADAQSAEGIDFEAFKLGSIFSGGKGISFIDNLTSSGATNLGGFASYAFDVTDGVNLNLTVGGVQATDFDEYAEKSDDNKETTTVKWLSAFSSRAQVKVKDVLNAELIYKINHKAASGKAVGPLSHTFGLYVMPQVLDALTLNIGGAAEVYGGDYGEDDTDYFDWGVDLRARYQVMDPLSITFFTNVSGTSLKDGRSMSKGIVGYDGSKGYAKEAKVKVAMWNHLTGRYKVNDLLTATLNVGLITPLSKIDVDNNSYGPEWRVTPGIQIFPEAEGKASLWAGVAISGASVEDVSVIGVDIPVIFRVKW